MIAALSGISCWAVVLFVWIAGVELDLKRAWLHRAESLIAAALALGVPLVLGGVAGGSRRMASFSISRMRTGRAVTAHAMPDVAIWGVLAVMPVFFLSTGLRTNWTLGGAVLAAGVLTIVSVGGKLIGAQLAGRILGRTRPQASIVGWLLQAKGLVMKQLISSETFTAPLPMALPSTMLTVPQVAPLLRGAPEVIHRSA